MKRAITLLLLHVMFCCISFAGQYEPRTVPNPRDVNADAYVCNPDDVLTAAEVRSLQRISEQIDSISGVELCIVALRDIGDADAFDFAYELANLWGVGKKDKDTGVLILLAVDSHDIQIVTGKGVEGVMTDGQCSLAIDDMMEDLGEERYGDGLIAGAKSVGRRVTTTDALAELLLGTKYDEPSSAPWSFFSFLFAIFGVGYTGCYYLKKKCRKCGQRTLKCTGNEVVTAATYDHPGQGVRHYVCKNCGEVFSETYKIPRLHRDNNNQTGAMMAGAGGAVFGNGGSGGGFSGGSFGGGLFGGGGAGRKF